MCSTSSPSQTRRGSTGPSIRICDDMKSRDWRPEAQNPRTRARERGFTLLEMIIVISIILILVSIAIPNYVQSMARAREAVLRDDLFQLRSTIDQYTLD